jgi:hypothetical protein
MMKCNSCQAEILAKDVPLCPYCGSRELVNVGVAEPEIDQSTNTTSGKGYSPHGTRAHIPLIAIATAALIVAFVFCYYTATASTVVGYWSVNYGSKIPLIPNPNPYRPDYLNPYIAPTIAPTISPPDIHYYTITENIWAHPFAAYATLLVVIGFAALLGALSIVCYKSLFAAQISEKRVRRKRYAKILVIGMLVGTLILAYISVSFYQAPPSSIGTYVGQTIIGRRDHGNGFTEAIWRPFWNDSQCDVNAALGASFNVTTSTGPHEFCVWHGTLWAITQTPNWSQVPIPIVISAVLLLLNCLLLGLAVVGGIVKLTERRGRQNQKKIRNKLTLKKEGRRVRNAINL